ncbi:unnamed protein product, partial [Mesorhabditis spiculigera]
MMTRTPPTKKPVTRIISEPQPSKAADESRSSPTPTVSAPTIPYNSIVAGVKCSSASELSERAITEVSAEPIAPAIQISTTEYPTINENLPPPAPSVAPKAPIAPPPVVAEPELLTVATNQGREVNDLRAVDGVIIQALSRMGSQANSLPTMSSPSVSDEVTGFTSAPPPPPPPPPKPPAASVQVDDDMRPEMALSPKAPEPVKQKRLRIPPPERAAIDRVLGRSTESKPERTENLKARLHQITPSLGACPLGPGSLTEGLVLQLKAIEAQMARRPIQFDWNKSTPQFSSRPTTIPTYFPSAPPHVSSSPEYFDRLAPETLFFLFYYSEGTEAQLLSARALKKASWRFHYGYHTWFQRKTTPHEITDTFEKGTYIYWDCEAWNYGQREDFCFETRSTPEVLKKVPSKTCSVDSNIAPDKKTQRAKGKSGKKDRKETPEKKETLEKKEAPEKKKKELFCATIAVTGSKADVLASTTDFIRSTKCLGIDNLCKQFEELKTYVPANPAATAFEANRVKNRYMDIPCLDETRVKLTIEDKEREGDYIHANWCKIPDGPTFIAAQAPLDTTIGDFWRMCWEHEVVNIVQLTKLQEGDKIKCSAYWPTEPGDHMNPSGWFVNNKKKEDKGGFNTLTIELLPNGCSNSRMLRIIQCLDWPDKGVPAGHREILRLLRVVADGDVLNPGQTLMHCSAGIGRTGSLILTSWALSRLYAGKRIDMKQLLQTLRDQRALAVQSTSQYLLVFLSCVEYITKKGTVPASDTATLITDLRNAMNAMQTLPATSH